MMTDAGYAGADWLNKGLGIENISPLGIKVADLLGDLVAGIYHMNHTSLKKVDWTNNYYIEVTYDRELATFDSDGLTRLVILCHDRKIRCGVNGLAPRYLRLIFHARKNRDGRMYERHPSIEQAVESIRADYT